LKTTENLSTLKIHKLTQAQYDRELEAGRIDPSALYLTPDEANEIYVQDGEPIDAEDGSLWIDLGEENGIVAGGSNGSGNSGSSGGSSVQLDITLSKSGYAADAKAVGDKIAGIKQVPSCTTSDNGKILMVQNGVASWQTIATWTGGSY
jgi:hypothetical protein